MNETTQFPAAVRQAMTTTGGCITCVPVQLDDGDWESAIFFALSGAGSATDLQKLQARRTVPFALDTDVIKHDNGAVVVIRVEIMPDEDDPLVGEILLLPGGNTQHFETLELLTRQARLGIRVGDERYRTVLSQYAPLTEAEHREFKSLLDEAVKHDAVVRLTNRYDADSAFAAVTANYALREPGDS